MDAILKLQLQKCSYVKKNMPHTSDALKKRKAMSFYIKFDNRLSQVKSHLNWLKKSVTSLPCDLLKETISSSSRLTQTMHIFIITSFSTLFLWIIHRNSEIFISPVTPFETSVICYASKMVFPSSFIQKMHKHTMVNGLGQIERSHGRKSLEIALIRLLLSTHPILTLYWVSSNPCHTKSEKEIYSFLKHQVKSDLQVWMLLVSVILKRNLEQSFLVRLFTFQKQYKNTTETRQS